MRVVVMGVAGSGKSTIGERLAEHLGVDYADADDFHSEANIEKMSAGTPLTDDDRWPWLESIADWLRERADDGAVVTCSALKRSYRDVLRKGAADACFLHLDGPPELMAERVGGRPGHFMPMELVQSQFETLEPLGSDERGVVVDASLPPDEIVDEFVQTMHQRD